MPTQRIFKTAVLNADLKLVCADAAKAYKETPGVEFGGRIENVMASCKIVKGERGDHAPQFIGETEADGFKVIISGVPSDFSRGHLVDAINERYGSSLSKDDIEEGRTSKFHNGFESRDLIIPLQKMIAARDCQKGLAVGSGTTP